MTTATKQFQAICSLRDVFEARKAIAPYLRPTPFHVSESLSAAIGAEVWLKYENLQPTRAFKVRGGLNVMAKLTAPERAAGVITASTGNHGQAIAYAGRLLNVPVTVAAPDNPNPLKARAIEALGATVVEAGPDLDAARAWAEATAADQGLRFIASAEPAIVAGAATMTLEMLELAPDLDVIITPVGGGSAACGHCLVGKALSPSLQVIGVQAEGCPAYWQAYHHGTTSPVDAVRTFAEGLAVRTPAPLAVPVLNSLLDDLVLATDAELQAAMALLIEKVGMIAEGAGAASTAAAVKLRDRLQGKKVAVILSGGNVTVDALRQVLQTA